MRELLSNFQYVLQSDYILFHDVLGVWWDLVSFKFTRDLAVKYVWKSV